MGMGIAAAFTFYSSSIKRNNAEFIAEAREGFTFYSSSIKSYNVCYKFRQIYQFTFYSSSIKRINIDTFYILFAYLHSTLVLLKVTAVTGERESDPAIYILL